ncbi:dihydrolipoyl dehydrogenase [Metallosphaera cuprina]|uniref:Dihydrolipoamide dehydrogenase n=1 Tax=Metallosphaera cuprina (strain Ar-4) TaxID=1006006 RepID=F4G370_METCR|nr:dihydrolipoyl dehydrogenase [Metallosphaera cuprina]AEB95268.1 dihydrolipoamide dehydrogenase [Metallosphaera cuprina Ar-4]
MDFDVVVIGAGGGGYPGAFRLAKSGYNVLMVDPKGVLGGNCLYSGCVPSKTVRELAHTIYRIKNVLGQEVKVDFKEIQRQKDRVQEIRFKQHERELSEHGGVTFMKGIARIRDPKNVIVDVDGKEVEVRAKYVLIASGSEPVKPKFPGSEYCITSDDLFEYKSKVSDLPQDMVIVGGGYIAIEVASVFSKLGVKTHLLVRGDRVLKGFPEQMVKTLLSSLKLDIMYNSPLFEVKKVGSEYEVIFGSGGVKRSLRTNLVMLATGRKAVIPKGSEGLTNEKGYIKTDEAMRTSLQNVFAAGDVNGLAPYFHAAVRMSLAAAYNIMANGEPIDYVDVRSVPVTLYSIPSASYVGNVNPSDAIEVTYNMEDEVMSQMYNEMDGVLKLFFERGSLRLLGGWMVGVHSQYLINEIGQAVAHGLTARQLAEFADQHPSTNEIVSYAARKVL